MNVSWIKTTQCQASFFFVTNFYKIDRWLAETKKMNKCKSALFFTTVNFYLSGFIKAINKNKSQNHNTHKCLQITM